MKQIGLKTPNLKNKSLVFRIRLICLVFLAFSSSLVFNRALAQDNSAVKALPPTPFRIGERITYNVSFDRFKNAAYAETYVVSRGKIGDKDVVELRSKLRTSEFVSAAFYLVDESRTTYASAETGLPLYIRKISNAGVLPTETINNYLVTPTFNFDWLTLIYRARNAGGTGVFTLQEDERIYSVGMQSSSAEKVRSDVGDFETNLSTVQSEFFVEKGITDFRINFSADEARLPVLIRFKTAKGEFRAEIAGVQLIEPETTEPTPTQTQTPRPQVTPKPVVTPTPYVNNQTLSAELPFVLGETLEYQVSANGKTLGIVTLQAKERKQFGVEDSLLFSAAVTGTQPGQTFLNLNDNITAKVNPETLVPMQIILKFGGANAAYNQTAVFDQKRGSALTDGVNRFDIPIGTHSLLSLAYAIRSFNLKPSKDANNPVNDTRVAVFFNSGAVVFYLRPSDAEIINLKGEKTAAQLISITTMGENSQVDALSPRLWLSTDERRIPLRLTLGVYQADLISDRLIPPK